MTNKLFVFCVLSLLAVSVRAQQTTIGYQGVLGKDGIVAPDGDYTITVTLYHDSLGAKSAWSGWYYVHTTNGVFNVLLGSGDYPLPPTAQLDGPLFVGLRIGASAELPLAQLSSAVSAMNVADGSITAKKMGTDYVSSISVNGQKVTGNGTGLNIVGNVMYDDASKSILVNAGAGNDASSKGAKAQTADTGSYWSETGNTSVPPPHYYLGTHDSEAFEIHINNIGDTNAGNGRVMRYEPMPNSPNIIGGFRTNTVKGGSYGGTIAGGGRETDSNQVSGNYGTIGGGFGNAVAEVGTVAGGTGNGAGPGGTVAGGGTNLAGETSAVGGGELNIANAAYATIGGGTFNETQPGSNYMTYPAFYSTIGGGISNYIYGTASAIPGGEGMRIGSYSFGFNADSTFWPGSLTNYTDLTGLTGIAYFGNVNMMIGNVDSLARQLRFYGPNTDHSYGSGAKYTSFRAPLLTADVPYTLPSAQGSSNQVLTNDGSGNLSWTTQIGAGGWLTTGNYHTHPDSNFIGTLDSNAFEIHLFDTAAPYGSNKRVMRYELGQTSPNIIGGSRYNTIDTGLSGAAILSGGSSTTPNNDSSRFAVILGGEANTIDIASDHSIISGGDSNYVGAPNGFIGGGSGNYVKDTLATVIGGSQNYAFYGSTASFIGGGYGNSDIGSPSAVLGGGSYNTITNSPYSTISGGWVNWIVNDTGGLIGGGSHNIIGNGNDATIAGGLWNYIASVSYAFIGGGSNNTTESDHSTIGGGDSNSISYDASFASILGGKNNLVQDSGAVIAGGMNDSILLLSSLHPSTNSFTGAGTKNKIEGDPIQPSSAENTAIVAGHNNTARNDNSFIGSGYNNFLNASEAFIGAGFNNTVMGATSAIIAGYQDTIRGGGASFIGAGWDNTIDSGYTFNSFIGAGTENFIGQDYDFIGAGAVNVNLGVFSGIGAGEFNRIDTVAHFSFESAGSDDTIRSPNGFIGAGSMNVIDSNAIGAAIPSGERLIAKSYAQTVLGFYNIPSGSTVDAYAAHSTAHGDDALVTVGRGLPDTLIGGTTHLRDSNAFTISNNGHISAYQNIGSGKILTNSTHIGTMYANNTIEAAGNYRAGDTTLFDDIGVGNFLDSAGGSGVYIIQLNVKNQDGTAHTFTAGRASITVSINQGLTGAPGLITVSELQTSGYTFSPTQPGFRIATWNASGTMLMNTFGFQFHVVLH